MTIDSNIDSCSTIINLQTFRISFDYFVCEFHIDELFYLIFHILRIESDSIKISLQIYRIISQLQRWFMEHFFWSFICSILSPLDNLSSIEEYY